MAKNSITDYDNTAANNTDVQSVDISEGCSPSGINNAIREVMADLADVNDGTVALTSPTIGTSFDMNGNELILDADGDTSITSDTDDQIDFKTGGSDRVTINSSGNVGIGTTSPDFKAEIVGGTNNGLHIKDAESATVYGGLFTQSANLALVARSNHALTFGTNDSERLRILSSGGLTFNGDTAQANALDDYEEGTWTPSFEMVSGSASFTYQANGQEGYYTKIGNQVTVWFIIHSAGATVTTDGSVRVSGLPFTSANNHARSYSVGFKQLLDVNEVGLLMAINPNTSKIEFYEGHTSYPESNRIVLASYLGADRRIRGTMTYMV